MSMNTPSLSVLNGVLEYLFLLHAIVSNAAATLIAPSTVNAVVPDATAKPTATLSPLHAVGPNAMARPTAAPSEDDGELDRNNGSGDVIAI
jgi:hypothetical protein